MRTERWTQLAMGTAALAFLTASPNRAGAQEVFNFQDEYYVSSLSEFHTLFGASTTGYGTAGIYQETQTGASPIVTKLSNGSSVPGEYVQNTTPNDSQFLSLTGWKASLNNGQQVGPNLYNLNNPINGAVLYFQYKVNGTTTPFTFNSFDLHAGSPSGSLSFVLEGFLNGQMVDSASLSVQGNAYSTYTENWQNVDTVEVTGINMGSGSLYMDNVTLNEPLNVPGPAVPESPSAVVDALLILPFGLRPLHHLCKRISLPKPL